MNKVYLIVLSLSLVAPLGHAHESPHEVTQAERVGNCTRHQMSLHGLINPYVENLNKALAEIATATGKKSNDEIRALVLGYARSFEADFLAMPNRLEFMRAFLVSCADVVEVQSNQQLLLDYQKAQEQFSGHVLRAQGF